MKKAGKWYSRGKVKEDIVDGFDGCQGQGEVGCESEVYWWGRVCGGGTFTDDAGGVGMRLNAFSRGLEFCLVDMGSDYIVKSFIK